MKNADKYLYIEQHCLKHGMEFNMDLFRKIHKICNNKTSYSGDKNINRWLNSSWGKILKLKYNGDADNFQRLYNPNKYKDFHEWLNFIVNDNRYISYTKYIQNLVKKYNIEKNEVVTLEMFLFYGRGVVSGGGSGRIEEERISRKRITNSQWDTPYAFHRIQEIRDSDFEMKHSYKDIVKIFRKSARKGYKKIINSDQLRKIYSRGIRMISSDI